MTIRGVNMDVRKTIKSQYYASLAMLRQAIEQCPDSLWSEPEDRNPFWHTAYHVLFYTHLYLQPSEGDFVPWDRHREGWTSLGQPAETSQAAEPYSKEDLLAYHGLCCEQVEEQVSGLDLGAESGFYWLPFDKLELQIYNIRHIQQHTGELYERLGAYGETEVGWVGIKPK
jgi:hypothetical protein